MTGNTGLPARQLDKITRITPITRGSVMDAVSSVERTDHPRYGKEFLPVWWLQSAVQQMCTSFSTGVGHLLAPFKCGWRLVAGWPATTAADCSDGGDADQAVAGDQRRQRQFVQVLGAGRAAGQDHVSGFRAGVPDVDLHGGIEHEAELA